MPTLPSEVIRMRSIEFVLNAIGWFDIVPKNPTLPLDQLILLSIVPSVTLKPLLELTNPTISRG